MTEIATIIKVFMEPGLKADSPAQATLRPGSVLNGRITDILPSGLLQINFGKFRTQARVKFPVAPGDTLRFEVLETGDPIKLKFQDSAPTPPKVPAERFFKPEDLNLLRQNLAAVLSKPGFPGMDRGSGENTRLLLQRISDQLLPLPAGRETGQLAPLIKSLLANSGMFFEKRLETVLLQIFKKPDQIDTGMARSHPFMTNIFDSDLKPNLLKLAALLAKPGAEGAPVLASIRVSALKLLNQIDAEQARLTHQAPSAPPRAGTYHQANSSLPGLPAGALKTLHQQLVKSGLWSDSEIRALARALFKPSELETDRYPASAKKEPGNPVASRLNPNARPLEKGALQKSLTGLMQSTPAPQLKTLQQFLMSFQAYARENRFRLDHKTAAALDRLSAITRKAGSRRASTPGFNHQTDTIKKQLNTLARFIESRPQPQTASPGSRKSGSGPRPHNSISANPREFPRTFSGSLPRSDADRMASKNAESGLHRFALLVEPKTANLDNELRRLDQTLAKLVSDGAVHPDGKKSAQTARTLRALIARHQLPADEVVNRALTTMAAGNRALKRKAPSGLKSGALSERLQADLMVLRDFIGQQRTELNETLDILKTLLGRTQAEADPGDRPGSEKARGADPVQVIAFSLPMEGGQKPARLKVYYPLKRRASTETGFRISLLLTMARMGPIRTDIYTHQNNLDVQFSTETEAARQHIGEHLDRLAKLLDDHFETINLTTAVDEKTIAAFEYENLELSANRLVDLQA